MNTQGKNVLIGAAGLVIMLLLALLFTRPEAGEVAGQAIGERSKEQIGAQSEQEQVDEFVDEHYGEFDSICDEVDSLMSGNTGNGQAQLSTSAHPCSPSELIPLDEDAFRECCEALGEMACNIYCRNQTDHSYNTCMNGFLWIDGCLDKVEDFCDEFIELAKKQKKAR